MKKRQSILTLVIFIVLFTSFASAQETRFGTDVRVSNNVADSFFPDIVVDLQNNAHIFWGDRRNSGFTEIFYRKLDTFGRALTPEMRASSYSQSSSNNPSAALDGNGNLHFVWDDNRIPPTSQVFYRKLDANGGSLTPEIQVSFTSAGASNPSVAVEPSRLRINGNVHVVWVDNRDGNQEIYYKKLDNNGQPLTPEKRLTNAPGGSLVPKLAIDSQGNVHVVWSDWRGTYSPYVQVYYTKLDNNGDTLIDDTLLTTIPTTGGNGASIGIDQQDNLHITWYDGRDGNSEIYYKKFDNNVQPLTQDIRLTTTPYQSSAPAIAVDVQNNVHITFLEGGSMDRVYYTKLDNNGNTLIDDTQLTTNVLGGLTHSPKIAADQQGYAYVAWPDARDYGTNAGEIYHRRSYPRIDLLLEGSACFGYSVNFNLFSYANAQYILLMSLSNQPGIQLSDGRVIPLSPTDPLFYLSLTNPLLVGLQGSTGTTNAQGQAGVRWTVPRDTPPGIIVYFGGITFDPLRPMPYTITSIFPTVPVTLPS